MVAERLKDCIRESDTLGRWGGDEFLLLLAGIPGPGHAISVVDKVLAVLRRPFTLGRAPCKISASVGIGIFPVHGLDPETVVKKADEAMYRAKEKGKNQAFLCEIDRDQSLVINVAR
jgi:diguanylate cyclase (GGDEF)-like protein